MGPSGIAQRYTEVISWIMAVGVRKVGDERHYVPKSKGGGLLRREIWADERGRVVRYNLAYINHGLYAGDNGRVLGYDSAHGRAHRHFRGEVTLLGAAGLARIEARFQREWEELIKEMTHGKD